jgi:hypothetical protein
MLPPYLSLLLCHDPVCLLHAPCQHSCSSAASPLLQAAMQAIQLVELLRYLLSPGKLLLLLLLRLWLQLLVKGSWLLANCSSGRSNFLRWWSQFHCCFPCAQCLPFAAQDTQEQQNQPAQLPSLDKAWSVVSPATASDESRAPLLATSASARRI